jgi:hypothetical protein
MAKLTWARLVQDFPVEKILLPRLVGLALEGPAKKIYEEVSALQLSSNSEELWEFLRTRLYNHSQCSEVKSHLGGHLLTPVRDCIHSTLTGTLG